MEDKIQYRLQASPSVAEIVSQWKRELPTLDASPILIIGQMARLTQLFEPFLRPPFAAAGLGDGDFDILAALRRSGHPFALSPGDLSTSLLVRSGSMTKRIDRLEKKALVHRTVSTSDARGRLVTLTPTGVELTEGLFATHLANEARLLSVLAAEQRDDLARLLGLLADSLES